MLAADIDSFAEGDCGDSEGHVGDGHADANEKSSEKRKGDHRIQQAEQDDECHGGAGDDPCDGCHDNDFTPLGDGGHAFGMLRFAFFTL